MPMTAAGGFGVWHLIGGSEVVDFCLRIGMEPKKVENHTSLTLKKAKNLKRKQTPPRHLVVTYKNVH